jgi:hypothetical protein
MPQSRSIRTAGITCFIPKNLISESCRGVFDGLDRESLEFVSSMDLAPQAAERLLQFDSGRNGVCAPSDLAVRALAGEAGETLFADLKSAGHLGSFELFASTDWLVGRCIAPQEPAVGAQTEALYAELFALTQARGHHLARVWNYVADINAESVEGLETYRAFCRGRSLAFERAGWSGPLPAASAVGGAPGKIGVVFAAARERPVARENPEQVPAFEYPPDYGPRPPSFSRAMQIKAGGRVWTFVSGTAAIKGHASQSPGDLAGQIACTLDNLRLISRECGLGDRLAVESAAERHFKIYLRRADDLDVVRASLEGEWLRQADRVTWLRTDICRAELLLEIESTVIE